MPEKGAEDTVAFYRAVLGPADFASLRDLTRLALATSPTIVDDTLALVAELGEKPSND